MRKVLETVEAEKATLQAKANKYKRRCSESKMRFQIAAGRRSVVGKKERKRLLKQIQRLLDELHSRNLKLIEHSGRKFLCLLLEAQDDPPHDLCCPLTHELFKDPVVASDFKTYEREEILCYFEGKLESLGPDAVITSPLTREEMTLEIVSDKGMKANVRTYLHGLCNQAAAAAATPGGPREVQL